MKKITFCLVMMASVSSMAATIECSKLNDWRLRPVSPVAIKLAKVLKVSTCTGKKFKKAVTDNKEKIVVVTATKAQKEIYFKAFPVKAAKKINLKAL